MKRLVLVSSLFAATPETIAESAVWYRSTRPTAARRVPAKWYVPKRLNTLPLHRMLAGQAKPENVAAAVAESFVMAYSAASVMFCERYETMPIQRWRVPPAVGWPTWP